MSGIKKGERPVENMLTRRSRTRQPITFTSQLAQDDGGQFELSFALRWPL